MAFPEVSFVVMNPQGSMRNGDFDPSITIESIAIKQGRLVCSEDSLVREGGLEPPRPFEHWHLKPARLPFRHSRE